MSEAEKPTKSPEAQTLDDATAPEEKRDSRTDSWRVRVEDELGDDEDEAVEALVGTVVAERYLVKSLLGRGGMGAVYRAEHVQLKKQVALKILHGYMSSNEEVVARFEREAVAAGRLEHPGIVTATDFGRIDDGSFYLALELVDGQALADVLGETGAFAPARALSIVLQINDALCAAHAEGIVHRDMKPDNVMLVRTEDGEDFVKVVDFGIAKMRLDEEHTEGLTRVGLVFGTPEYMSPEQAMGNEADARSDLYGLGMIFYEMLAGRSPFSQDDVTAMLTAQIKDPPPPLSESIPQEIRATVFSLLEKDPEKRPESAYALAEQLAALAQALQIPMPAPRTSAGVRLDISRKVADTRPKIVDTVQRFSMAPVAIGRKKVPRWVPLMGLLAGIGIGVFVMLKKRPSAPPPAVPQVTEHIDAEAQLLVDAIGGDRDAIAELRKVTAAAHKELESAGLLPEKSAPGAATKPNKAPEALPGGEENPVLKQANRYLVLGRGYGVIKHYSASLEMYREAVALDPHLSEDAELLVDVRVALGARDAVEDGLDFALHQLGAHGADLIYDVYLDHIGEAGMTSVVARAMKMARSDELLKHATPELQIALRLQNAKVCGEFRDLIPDAAKYADDRSLMKLRALQARRGCGTHGNKDCFVCLRKDDIPLDAAVERAESHPSPSFLTPDEEEAEKAAGPGNPSVSGTPAVPTAPAAPAAPAAP